MTSKLQLSHLETPDGLRTIPLTNIAEMTGAITNGISGA